MYCKSNEIIGFASFRLGMWKLRCKRRNVEKGEMLPINDDVNVAHILGLLQCNETKKWQEQFLDNKWLHIHEEIAYKKIIGGNEITELNNLGKYLYRVKSKWKN
jgi:hypothetical protein